MNKQRYSRNILLEELGRAGHERLLSSRVQIVGAGALGSVTAMYLCASGVGRLRLIDYDTIDVSNLQRQLSFSEAQCGRLKAEMLAERLHAINPEVAVEVHTQMLTRANVGALMEDIDLVLEGSDNPATKYLVTDECERRGIPYVLGGVAQWRGQVMAWRPGQPGYRELFPESADEGGYTPCALGGVLGPLPGVIGSMQACEAIKLLTGVGTPLLGRMLLYDALHGTTNVIEF